MATVFYKTPASTLDYTVSWAGVFGADPVASYSWALPSGITAVGGTTSAAIKLSGGTLDVDYLVTATATSAGGLVDTRQLLIKVRVPELVESIARFRRMIAEPTAATYDDGELETIITRYPLNDRRGLQSDYIRDWNPPVYVSNPDWIATYDMNAAAAAVWTEKAAAIAACSFDFKTDAGSFSKSQKYTAYMQQARYYAARRMVKPIKSYPDRGREDREGYIVNSEDYP